MLWGFMLAWSTGAMAAIRVSLILSDTSPAYQTAANSLRQSLRQDDARWAIREEARSARKGPAGEDLVIPLGAAALRAALAEPGNAPIWALMVTRAEFERADSQRTAGRRRPLSALYLDQPPSRQIHMLLSALPRAKRIGILANGKGASAIHSLRQAAAKRGMALSVMRVNRSGDEIAVLGDSKGRIDILLLHDSWFVDNAMLRSLFLETYRRGLPVMAHSASRIAAGAMLALYTSPGRIGQEAGQRLRQAWRNGDRRLPPPDYPRGFDVAVNRSVALALDIRVPTGELIRQRMMRNVGR